MRILMAGLLLATTAALAAPPDHIPRRPRVVKALDLERLADGVWYGIASIPSRHQKDCACCPESEFELREDGKIIMINRCETDDGSIKVFEAEAEVVDTRTNARWKMAPFKIFGLKPVKADMWFIGLGEDYAWVVVGDPDRKRGWVMAREPELAPETTAEIDALLVSQGYDPDDFVPPGRRP